MSGRAAASDGVGPVRRRPPGADHDRRAGGRRLRLADLAVRPRVGPHGRRGVAWAALVTGALLAGPLALALVLAAASGLAAAQAAVSWRSRRRRPAPPVAGGGAAVVVLAALVGPLAVAVAVVAVAVLAGLGSRVGGGGRRADPLLTVALAALVGLAGAGPVLLRGVGLAPAFVLLAYAFVHDTGAYLVGTGASGAWEGPAAGVACIAAVTLAVATALVPPFRGSSPWILGAAAVVLVPAGPLVGSALLGDRTGRHPALRRIDSLLVHGPVWSLVAVLLLP